MPPMLHLAQDVGFALRMLRRLPTFTVTVVLTLALGIGLTSAVFSVFHAVLLRPLAYPDQDRVMWISMRDTQAPFPTSIVLAPDFVDWRTQAGSFEHLVAYEMSDDGVIVDGMATRERIAGVSDGFWELSGARPAYGRLPAPAERNAVLVSYPFFEARLSGNIASVGKAITVDGHSLTIVGILPRDFSLQLPWPGWPGFEPRAPVAYRTTVIEAARGGPLQLLNVIGKLRAGVTVEQAQAEIAAIRARVTQDHPQYPGNRMTLDIVPLAEELSGGARPALSVLFAAVVFVLAIACANVANLLLGRGSARRKEIAIRAAVGAGRGRLLRQLMIESLMLAIAGGATGLLLARWAVALIVALDPYVLPRLSESSIDVPVVLFTLVTSILTALAFGIGPAFAIGTVKLSNTLNVSVRPMSAFPMYRRTGRLLVALEMALAVVLLTGAGLLIKSFWRLNAHPAELQPEQVLTLKVQFSGPQYDVEQRRRAYVTDFLRTIESIPGVIAAGISTHGDIRSVALVEGVPPAPPEEVMQRSSVLVNSVSAGSARALGLRIVRGRWFSEGDPANVVVVNESLARRDFPDRDPIGRRIRLDSDAAPLATILGIVADLQYTTLDEKPEPEVYLPYTHDAPGRFTGVVRTGIDPHAVLPALRQSVSAIDPTLALFDIQTLEQALANSVAPRRFNLFVLTIFAAAALGLATTGIYGVTAYSVAQRTQEIGIRMALGADARTVVTMIVRQGAITALAGVAGGLIGALFLTRLMEQLLYEVRPLDLPTFAVVAVGLMLVALAASFIPALRGARVHPADTLR